MAIPSNNETLQRRREDAVPRGVTTALPRFATRAGNATVWDADGNELIDFSGGIGTLNVGHLNQAVTDAVSGQLARYTHTAFQVLPYEPYIAVAERLNAIVPTGRSNKTILMTTGAEAVENAIKIARVATGRPAVIAFAGAFHGRTAMGMALTGKYAPYKIGFGPLPAQVHHIPFPDPAHGVSEEASLFALASLFKVTVAPDQVAAIIFEPVQGEGGFNVAPFSFVAALRKICDEHGIVLIADEIQSGFGRTGKMFAIEHSDVPIDIMTIAKSLGGGLPLSAVTGAAEIMDAVPPGGLGSTYAGSPLACAAALAVFDVMERDDLLGASARIGDTVRARLNMIAQMDNSSGLANIRGLGGMVAVDLVKPSGEPDADIARATVQAAIKRNLVILTCGPYGNAIRFLMPLTIPDAQLEDGLDRFAAALTEARMESQETVAPALA